MRQQYAWRSLVLNGTLAVIAVLIVLQMVRIQASAEASQFRMQADVFSGTFITYYPERGEMLDRNGHLLAGNRTVYEVGVDLKAMKDPYSIASAVSNYLGKDYNKVFETITNPPSDLSFLVIENFAQPDGVEQIQKLQDDFKNQANPTHNLVGLEFHARLQRSYPEEALASNLIGFVNQEGRGYFGVEEKYNDVLAGNPVQVWVPSDPNRAIEIPRIPNGTSLILTINRDLQDEVEKILEQSLYEYGADAGTITIMDPTSGEILALASTPRMDLNGFWNYTTIYQNASEYNRAISSPYEPGSVIKIFTMAAGLDTGLVSPETTFLDTGEFQIGGSIIKNWNGEAWGIQNMVGCLQHSLNVCMAWLATQLGPQNFYGYMNRFGFGHPTGVDLAGEAAGRLKVPGDGDWYPIDLGTNSFGQGMTATPLQVMTAASAVANKGHMVTPHVLFAMLRDGHQFNVPPQYTGSPITTETANTLNQMLSISLENEASAALVPGYRIAGKTGTAQIPTPYGIYDFSQTNTSFIGWGPVDDPKFMIYVWLERPSTSIWGSETAAPIFSEVAQKTVILLDIPPDAVRQQLAIP